MLRSGPRPRGPKAFFLASALGVLSLLAGGCGAASGDGSPVATIYISAPLSGPASADGRDIRDGVLLALIDAGGNPSGGSVEGVEVGGAQVRVEFSGDATGSARFSPAKTAANARAASEDSTAIAYIGELDSGATRVSVPITNQAGILQVSPGSGAGDLVRAQPFNDNVPTEFQTTGKRTFARLVPSDEEQGVAAANWVNKALGGPALIIDDGSGFGNELTDGFQSGRQGATPVAAGAAKGSQGCSRAIGEARKLVGARSPAGPGKTAGRPVADPVVYLAAEPACAARALGVLSQAGYVATPFGSDAMATPAGLTAMRSVDPSALVTVAAPKSSDLPANGREMASRFRSRFGRDPGRYAAYGYEAMASVLAAIDRSGDATDRDSVVSAYFDGTARDSVIGRYSIDGTGEPTGLGVSLYSVGPGGTLGAKPQRPGLRSGK